MTRVRQDLDKIREIDETIITLLEEVAPLFEDSQTAMVRTILVSPLAGARLSL
jgi:hypothetical protein